MIGDSSDGENLDKNKEIIAYYKDKINLEYYEYPNLGQGYVSYNLVKKIHTKYSTFLADDDLIISDFLEKGVNFLEKDEKISGVNGKAILIDIENDEPFGKIEKIRNYFDLAEEKNDSPIERINHCLENWKNVNICITRTESNKKIFEAVNKLSPINSNYNFEEIIFAIVTLSRGKILSLNSFFLVRQHHRNQFYHLIQPYCWISDSGFNDAIRISESIFEEEIKANFGDESENNTYHFQKIFINFLRNYLIKVNSETFFLRRRLIKILEILKLRWFFELLYSQFKFRKLPVMIGNFLPTKTDKEQLKIITQLIEESIEK